MGTPARRQLAGDARRPHVVLEQGLGDGTTVWGLDQPGLPWVVPAHTTRAVTADAGVHTVRQGQGRTAWAARLEPAVGGRTGLTPEAHAGRPAQGRPPQRREVQPPPLHAVVVRQWRGTDDGPGGHTGVRTQASVATPRPPVDAEDARRLSETGGLQAATPPGDLGPPPQQPARAVRVQVLCTRRRCALATASRLPCEREAGGEEPVGWPRWRRPLPAQPRDAGIVCAPGPAGRWPLAADSRRCGVTRTEVPPALGRRPRVLATPGLPARGSRRCGNFRLFS
ncbi:MAG TPA: hypothetical protein VGC99_24990 [Candidatus Tectomicrobia bacterium]